jgi:hypothetical protein
MSKASDTGLSVLLVLAVAGVGGWLWWQEQAVQQQVEDHTVAQIDRFRQLPLAQAVSHCHALWLQNHWDQAPLALAWQPGRLDWYVLEGMESASMRHFRCDGAVAERGARHPRILRERDPAPTGEPRNVLRDLNLFTHYAQAGVDPALVALEAAQDPQDPRGPAPIERRWSADGRAVQRGPVAADFALLFSQRPAPLAAAPFAPLAPLTATNWLKQPQAAFALLSDHVPPDARIARLSFGSDGISLTIRGRIQNLDGKPPAAFGDARFDEYGVRDADWWYPRDDPTYGCSVGHTLAEVRSMFLQHRSAGDPDLLSADYGCRGRNTAPTHGEWVLRLPRRR